MAGRESAEQTLARITAEFEARKANALGPLRAAADRREADEERAVRLAADNLLDKALRRLGDGEEAMARRFVERVFALELEGSAPGDEGALAVHLFVWDALREESVESDDDGWVDRVEEVAGTLDEVARREWLDAVDALLEDDVLSGDAARRLALLAGRRPDREAFDGVAAADRIDATLALLRGLLAVAI